MARKAAVNADETRDQIIDSAFSLFGRYGYDGVSVDQIAQRCGLSKGAMYWHYKGKDELFVACLGRLHGLFMSDIFQPVADAPDAVSAISIFFQGLNKLLEEPEITQGIAGFWMEPGRGDLARIAAVRAEFEEASAKIVAEVFRTGIDAGLLNIETDPLVMSRAMMAVMEASVLPLRQHTAEENAQTLEILMETFFRAYGTEAVLRN